MRAIRLMIGAALWVAIAIAPSLAQQGKTGVDRLTVLDCGQGQAPDQSRWSPGVNVGKPLDVTDNCYLIHHAQGYFLWDTRIPDAVAGQPGQNGSPTWRRPKTLAAQLEQIGVKPADIRYVAISHTHPDHIGNVELFPQAMLLVQKAEYDWPTRPAASGLSPSIRQPRSKATTMCSATAA
jgi:glyoxylase-like metal-dependent hydrolase (beta-lactamase superfamily II)